MSIAFLALAAFLTWLSFSKKLLLLSLTTTILWLALFFWIFFSSTPILDFNEGYAPFVLYAIAVLAFLPLLALMDTEIKMEMKGKKWTEWGARPKISKGSSYESYAKELRRRVRRGRGR